MSFLNPNYLWALSSVAIPILVHLFNFRKFKKVAFTNVHFLKELQIQSTAQQKIKNRLILLARVLAIITLVLAFARPFVSTTSGTHATSVVSIFIDNSPSMENLSKEGTLLEDAKLKAKEVASAYNLNDKFQLLTNDFEGHSQRLLSYDEFIEAVQEIKLTANSRSIEDVVKRQASIFYGNDYANKVIYVISDFQKNFLTTQPIKLDPSIHTYLLQIKGNNLPNLTVDSISFISPIHQPNTNEQLVIKTHNYSNQDAENVPLKLLINRQQKSIATISLKARSFRVDTLKFSRLTSGWQEGIININDNPITFDNNFYFAFEVKSRIDVALINGKHASNYIKSVFATDPFFHTVEFNEDNINYSQLSSASLLVLNELHTISSGFTEQLRRYVEHGGHILFVPSYTADLRTYQTFLKSVSANFPIHLVNKEESVQTLHIKDKVFEGVFEYLPKKVEMPSMKRYFELSKQNQVIEQNLLELPQGKPFLTRYKHKRGAVIFSAVAFSDETSNFSRHAIFVPMMYRLALLGISDAWLYYPIGYAKSIRVPNTLLLGDNILKMSKNDVEFIPTIHKTEFETELELSDQVRVAGNYHLKKADSTLAIIAFNPNHLESDMTYGDLSSVQDVFKNHQVKWMSGSEYSIRNIVNGANSSDSLWKVFALLALFFLLIEIIIIKYFKYISTKYNTLNPL